MRDKLQLYYTYIIVTLSLELVSLGGLGDSYYEYLLKRFLLGSKKEPLYRELYDESMQVCRQISVCACVVVRVRAW